MSPLRWMQALPPPDKQLPPKHYIVLVRLALAMNRDGAGWVSAARLADEAGVSASTVQRAIGRAIDAKLVERVTRGHHVTGKRAVASTYRLLP